MGEGPRLQLRPFARCNWVIIGVAIIRELAPIEKGSGLHEELEPDFLLAIVIQTKFICDSSAAQLRSPTVPDTKQ